MTKHYSKKAPNIVTEISAEVDNFFCLVSFSIHFLSLCLNFSFIFSKFTERLIHVHTKIISKWSDIYCGVSFETDFKAFIIFFFPLSRLGGKKQTNKTQVHNFINLKYLEKIAKKKYSLCRYVLPFHKASQFLSSMFFSYQTVWKINLLRKQGKSLDLLFPYIVHQ